MSKFRPLYPLEFREKMVALVRSGRAPEELAKEFEPSAQNIRNWVKLADLDTGRRTDSLTAEDREEFSRLRQENRELKMEREILRKAAAWFVQEAGSFPDKPSSS